MTKQFTAIINHGKKNKTIQGQFSEVLGSIAEAMLDNHVNSIIIYKDGDKLVQPNQIQVVPALEVSRQRGK